MVFRQFSVFLAIRLVIVGLALAAAVLLLIMPGYHSASILAVSALIAATIELWWFIGRTNREVARFLDAARHADYSQRFSLDGIGTGFGELGQTFTDILNRMYDQRADHEHETRRLKALIDHIPVPLLTVHGDHSITLQNNAARRLFGASHVTRLSDLRQFGSNFHDTVAETVPGNRELVTFRVAGVEYQLTLATTENIVAGESNRLISLQDIQSELDSTQAMAWQDLVRVLTHEIMNSMTPVTSLATTATEIVDDILKKTGADAPIADDLSELRDAVNTVARRSDSLMQFVNSYRQLTRLAPPEKKREQISDIFESVRRLATAEWPESEGSIFHEVKPSGLDVHADRVLLEPVILNLLKNAWEVTRTLDQAEIQLRGRLNRRGNVIIEISDNGPGVPDEIAQQIFVPFFTTKESGSGVGLALARQVMTAHGGFIRVGQNAGGGAKFTLTF